MLTAKNDDQESREESDHEPPKQQKPNSACQAGELRAVRKIPAARFAMVVERRGCLMDRRQRYAENGQRPDWIKSVPFAAGMDVSRMA